MSLVQCRIRTALELSRTKRSADDRYYYETPEFDSIHAECSDIVSSYRVNCNLHSKTVIHLAAVGSAVPNDRSKNISTVA